MNPILLWAGVVLCAGVILACICRVNMLQWGRNKAGWILLYICWAPFAGGIMIDLVTDRWVDWWACTGIAGVALHLLMTRKRWALGPPLETQLQP